MQISFFFVTAFFGTDLQSTGRQWGPNQKIALVTGASSRIMSLFSWRPGGMPEYTIYLFKHNIGDTQKKSSFFQVFLVVLWLNLIGVNSSVWDSFYIKPLDKNAIYFCWKREALAISNAAKISNILSITVKNYTITSELWVVYFIFHIDIRKIE